MGALKDFISPCLHIERGIAKPKEIQISILRETIPESRLRRQLGDRHPAWAEQTLRELALDWLISE